MIALGSGAVFLLAGHFGLASSGLREVLVRCLRGRGYLGSYSLVTLVALAGLVAAYRIAGILRFGSVAVLGLAGTGVLDERKGRRYPIEWARFPLGEIGRWRLVLAVVLIGAAGAGRRWAFRPVRLLTRGML